MGAGDQVIRPQCRADPDGHCFLPYIRVCAADDLAVLDQIEYEFFESADQPHRPVEVCDRHPSDRQITGQKSGSA